MSFVSKVVVVMQLFPKNREDFKGSNHFGSGGWKIKKENEPGPGSYNDDIVKHMRHQSARPRFGKALSGKLYSPSRVVI